MGRYIQDISANQTAQTFMYCMVAVHYYNDYITGQVGGPNGLVSIAAFHTKVRGSFPGLGGLKEINYSPSTRKTQYCGEHP